MLKSASLFAACSLLLLAAPAAAKTRVVHPGDSIQAAVDAANPGDTIHVMPGTYQEPGTPCPTNPATTCAVSITKPGIALVAKPKHRKPVVIENPDGQRHGIAVAPPNLSPTTCLEGSAQRLSGVTIRGFTVNGFDAMGIFLTCVDRFDIRFNETNDNAEYGIFPSHSTRGRVAFNVATGSHDTGIYIGQSHRVRVDHNLAHDNVSGFEIENSSEVRTDHNVATGNTGGILSFTLPGLDVKENARNRIDHNWVQDNDRPNTCLDPEDAVCAVPPGTGILALAADANRVDHNVVLDNDSYGIAVANFCLASGLTEEQCAALDIDPDPDRNKVDHNLVLENGHDPSPLVAPVFAVDLAWDTTGDGNCWKKNKSQTQFPDSLPACN